MVNLTHEILKNGSWEIMHMGNYRPGVAIMEEQKLVIFYQENEKNPNSAIGKHSRKPSKIIFDNAMHPINMEYELIEKDEEKHGFYKNILQEKNLWREPSNGN